ncbi:hypothetical protein CW304_02675 [Bacillus sp. UFRGS-B20]|nr:hypothetical protein CW304_02675 [Bacillus sp. UFRGS-B20]
MLLMSRRPRKGIPIPFYHTSLYFVEKRRIITIRHALSSCLLWSWTIVYSFGHVNLQIFSNFQFFIYPGNGTSHWHTCYINYHR